MKFFEIEFFLKWCKTPETGKTFQISRKASAIPFGAYLNFGWSEKNRAVCNNRCGGKCFWLLVFCWFGFVIVSQTLFSLFHRLLRFFNVIDRRYSHSLIFVSLLYSFVFLFRVFFVCKQKHWSPQTRVMFFLSSLTVLFCFVLRFDLFTVQKKNSNKTKHVTEELTLSSYKQRQVGKERTIFSSVTFVWFSISSFILNTMIIRNNNSRNVSIEPLKYRIIN